MEQASLLIERAWKTSARSLKIHLLLFLVLYGVWVGNFVAFSGDAAWEFANGEVPRAG